MANPSLILHIGLHKTGTTVLQKAVFPFLPNAEYLGKPFNGPDALHRIAKSKHDVLIVSSESMIGTLLDAYLEELPKPAYLNSQLEGIRRLGRVIPNAKVIIGIRNHVSWIGSVYKHYLKYGGTLPFQDFFRLSEGKSLMHPHDFLFLPRLQLACESFPSGVFVYDQSSLRCNPQAVLDKMCSFIGVPSINLSNPLPSLNEGVGQRGSNLLRRLNASRWIKVLCCTKLARCLKLDPFNIAHLLVRSDTPFQLESNVCADLENMYASDWHSALHFVSRS